MSPSSHDWTGVQPSCGGCATRCLDWAKHISTLVVNLCHHYPDIGQTFTLLSKVKSSAITDIIKFWSRHGIVINLLFLCAYNATRRRTYDSMAAHVALLSTGIQNPHLGGKQSWQAIRHQLPPNAINFICMQVCMYILGHRLSEVLGYTNAWMPVTARPSIRL